MRIRRIMLIILDRNARADDIRPYVGASFRRGRRPRRPARTRAQNTAALFSLFSCRRDDHWSSAIHLRSASDKRTSDARPCGGAAANLPPSSRTAGFPDAVCRILSKNCLHNLFVDRRRSVSQSFECYRTGRKRRRSGSNLAILCQRKMRPNRAVSRCFGRASMLNYY